MSEKATVQETVAACKRIGITVGGLPKRRAKLPTTKMGRLADDLHEIREARLALNKVVEAVKREETRIADHIIDNIDIDTEGGVMGAAYKATVVRDEQYTMEDPDKFYAHVKRTGNFHYLNKALNKGSIRERVEAGKPVPGVGSITIKKISLTKV